VSEFGGGSGPATLIVSGMIGDKPLERFDLPDLPIIGVRGHPYAGQQ
jgi:hypothetical protein